MQKKRNRPNYFYSIVSVALVLFLLGFFGLVILQAQNLVKLFKEKVSIFVELKNEASVKELEQLKTSLASESFIKANSIELITKQEAADLMMKEEGFGETFLSLDLPNPFYDVLLFNVKAAHLAPDSLQNIKTSLLKNAVVHDVYYQENLVSNIEKNIQYVGWSALGIGSFFLILALTLIHNTIRLAMYANRFIIKNMQLVGASWGFISRPYLLKSIVNGVISATLAIIGLLLLLLLSQQDIPELKNVHDTFDIVILFMVLTILGVSITVLSTYYTVNKYLKMRIDDLY